MKPTLPLDHIRFENISLMASNFKCFHDRQGFESLRSINLIVGRNNAGKSALLDLIQSTIAPGTTELIRQGGRDPRIEFGYRIDQGLIDAALENSKGLPEVEAFKRYASKNLIDRLLPGNIHLETGDIVINELSDLCSGFRDHEKLRGLFANNLRSVFRRYKFRRLQAERDVPAELEEESLDLKPTGARATNIIRMFWTHSSLPSEMISEQLVDDLQKIFGPDCTFRNVMPRKRPDRFWEVFLDEKTKGWVPLTHTGSGIKTAILVLLNLRFLPHVFGEPLAHFVFAFEELEHSLHPAVQRRLLAFLREMALLEGCHFFLTTHSSVILDQFSRDPAAQILHVTHDGTNAHVSRVETYVHKRSVLDDLEVRASDLLQSNAIVWVEGPSDRLYFNRWIELWDEGLKEGQHYQCLTYGGSLIANWSFDDPALEADLMQALRINAHAILLVDRDRASKDDALKPNAARVCTELEGMGGHPWVTAGRTIENYVPAAVLASHFKLASGPTSQFVDLYGWLVEHGAGKFSHRKVELARQIVPNLKVDHLEGTLNLALHLTAVCAKLRHWNGLERRVRSPSQT